MNRRSFFRSLSKAAAIVALAPQLAFRSKPQLPEIQHLETFWYQEERASMRMNEKNKAFFAQFEAKAMLFPPSIQDFFNNQKPNPTE